jgi:hypothetical protein
MRAKLMILAAAAVSGCLLPRSAAAQSSPPPSPPVSRGQPSPEEVLRDLLAHASDAFDQGDFKEARDYYRAALRRKADREIACNLGVAARLAGSLVEAAYALARCLAEPLSPLATQDEKQRRVRYESDRQVVRLQTGALTIKTITGARVLIGAESIGTAPLSTDVFVLPGAHTVTVERGDRKASRSIVISGGERVTLALTPEPPPTERKTALSRVPVPASESRPLVIFGEVLTGIALSLGFVTYAASRVVGAGATFDPDKARKEHPAGCAVPNPGTYCREFVATWQTAGTLQTIGVTGLMMGAAFGGGTLIYSIGTRPAAPSLPTGAMIGWRRAW